MLTLWGDPPKISITMRIKKLFAIALLGLSAAAFADSSNTTPLNMQHRFYIGAMTGYGNTDWGRLVSEDDVSALATPTQASGSGLILGALVGYQITPYIDIQAQYIHYPTSSITLAPDNLIYPPNVSNFNSTTNYYAIIPQISAPFDNDHYEVFGSLGAAMVQRSDVLTHSHDYRPTFGFGANDNLSSHWTASVAFNYTPGSGSASQYATTYYIPYLYSGQFIIAYRI